MFFHTPSVSVTALDDFICYFSSEQKIKKKTIILAEFLILAEIEDLQSDFPGLLLFFSISRWRVNFFIRMFTFSFL